VTLIILVPLLLVVLVWFIVRRVRHRKAGE
jgi:hypothetical protein